MANIKPVSKIKLPAWNLIALAAALHTDLVHAGQFFCDGRITNWVIALHLAAHGFDMVDEKKVKAKGSATGGGHFLISKRTGAIYKLKIATNKVDLTPPKNSGMNRPLDMASVAALQGVSDGFAIVFTAELCCHVKNKNCPSQDCVYFVSHSFVKQMVADGILSAKYRADKSEPVMEYLRKQLGEPTFASVAQDAVAASREETAATA